MNDVLLIALAGLLVFIVGYPFVVALDKWKKQMEAEEGENDVQDR